MKGGGVGEDAGSDSDDHVNMEVGGDENNGNKRWVTGGW